MAVVTSALETLSKERDAGLKEMKHHIQEEIQENRKESLRRLSRN